MQHCLRYGIESEINTFIDAFLRANLIFSTDLMVSKAQIFLTTDLMILKSLNILAMGVMLSEIPEYFDN